MQISRHIVLQSCSAAGWWFSWAFDTYWTLKTTGLWSDVWLVLPSLCGGQGWCLSFLLESGRLCANFLQRVRRCNINVLSGFYYRVASISNHESPTFVGSEPTSLTLFSRVQSSLMHLSGPDTFPGSRQNKCFVWFCVLLCWHKLPA